MHGGDGTIVSTIALGCNTTHILITDRPPGSRVGIHLVLLESR